ncbi:hypothetical protein [Sphingomonas sp. Leaf343]|uniref:hypothetical protein n=1 Tax=Sphingomonas sp. Leaf343 TaxID=1736345 RepID=UPI000700C04A|nr:hypothetical protein [Sphingomonas sp. Leaf343]KQR85276.1 hypothetical protein ASG07_16540 [Sphingomonas sp. Leaf343]
MNDLVAKVLMVAAERCLGRQRQDWALAMRAEFGSALEDGHALTFAAGCLLAALREMPAQEEGRFVITSYALALGLILPIAALQIGCAVFGLPYMFARGAGLQAIAAPGSVQAALLGGTYQAAVPALTVVLLLLGVWQVRMAWVMLERDWPRVTASAMRILAASVTLATVMAALFLDATQAVLQIGMLVLEMAAVLVLANWHEHLPAPPTQQLTTR